MKTCNVSLCVCRATKPLYLICRHIILYTDKSSVTFWLHLEEGAGRWVLRHGRGDKSGSPPHPFLLLQAGAALNPPTDAHCLQLAIRGQNHQPITIQLHSFDGDIVRDSGLVRRGVLFWPGSGSRRIDGSDELQVFFGENNNTVSWTQRSCWSSLPRASLRTFLVFWRPLVLCGSLLTAHCGQGEFIFH